MTQFVKVEAATGRIIGGRGRPDPADFDGTPELTPFPHDGFVYHAWQGRLDFGAQPSPTSAYLWVDGEPKWVEVGTLAEAVDAAVLKIDSEADLARLQIVGDPTKIAEYQRAEIQAREYQAGGYVGTPPPCVECWARAKGWPGEQAANDIIATADAWYRLMERIRDLRLCAKEAVRNAPDSGAVAARAQQFTADLANLMKGTA